jgi:hypothetical protein
VAHSPRIVRCSAGAAGSVGRPVAETSVSTGPEVGPHQVVGLFGCVPVSVVGPVRLGHRQGDVVLRGGLLLTG